MKILHIMLGSFYLDKFSYQENILPCKHRELGHNVVILAPAQEKHTDGSIVYIKNDYINSDNIPVKILTFDKQYGKIGRVYKKYYYLYNKIEEEKPDIIFVHGGQAISLLDIIKYKKKHRNVQLFIDQHGDYYNSPVVKFKSKLNAKYFIGAILKKSIPYTTKYYGTTPWRCQFLNDIYNIPNDKIDLLIMGGDENKINFANKSNLRNEIRKNYAIAENDFLIVTGGKIDRTKNIHLLAEAVDKLKLPNVKLIIFGNYTKEMENEFEKYIENKSIIKAGWINGDKAYDYFLASDLAVFPGTHSVLWEQACACGIPIIVKDWAGMHHVDCKGNCIFLEKDSCDEIQQILQDIVVDKVKYNKMLETANTSKEKFFYSKIAQKVINDCKN